MKKIKTYQLQKHQDWLFLLACLTVALLTCVSQIRGSRILLYGSMGLFLVLSAFVSRMEMVFPFLLFFLPWSPLIKLYSGSISFYTISMLLFCLFRSVFVSIENCCFQ